MLCGPQGPTHPQRPHGTLHGALCRCGQLKPEHGLRSQRHPGSWTRVPSLLSPHTAPSDSSQAAHPTPTPRAPRPSGHLREQAAPRLKVSMSPVCTTRELGGGSVQRVNVSFPLAGPLT